MQTNGPARCIPRSSGSPGKLPALRNGAGSTRGPTKPPIRSEGNEPPPLGRGLLTLPLLAAMVSDFFRKATPTLDRGGPAWLAGVGFRDSCRSLVQLAFLRARVGLVVHRSLNMFTLIAIGTGAAYLYSLVAVIAPGIFPPTARDSSGGVPPYFEAAAVITVLVLLGQVLELRARHQTGPRFALCWGSRPRPLASSPPMAARADVSLAEITRGTASRASRRKDSGRWPLLEGRSSVESP